MLQSTNNVEENFRQQKTTHMVNQFYLLVEGMHKDILLLDTLAIIIRKYGLYNSWNQENT